MGDIEKSDKAEGAAGTFPTTFPANCPAIGQPVDATIYHGCIHSPPDGDDFVPFAYSNDAGRRERAAKRGCDAWGISCWKDEAAALHAQKAFGWAAKWHIYKGDVTQKDGKLAHTPSGNQAEHHTFWCYDGVSIKERFTRALPPYHGFGK